MNLNTLKSLILTTVIIALSSHFAISQLYFWSAPLSVSDSLADNRNAVIADIQFNGTFSHYIFWERSADSTATAIYYKDFYSEDPPVALLAAENTHYRNPRVMWVHFLEGDTLFYFFYESDQSGNYDIYYKVYTTSGFGDAELLAGTGAEESHFRCNGGGSMVWQEGDKIKFAWLNNAHSILNISEPVTIDSINCSSPDVPQADYFCSNPTYVCWLKNSGENVSVYFNYYLDDNWLAPVLLSDPGINASPHFAQAACYGGGSVMDVIIWESIINGEYTIKAHNFWDGDLNCTFSQGSSFFPVISNYMVPVDELFIDGFMAFVNADVQNGDIFINDDGYGIPESLEYYQNLSDSPAEETNPTFYNGRCFTYFCDLILVWESKHNDHWQLYYSTNNLMCSGNINETEETTGIELNVSPNPVRYECDITYTINEDSPVSLQLYTLDGRQIKLTDQKFLQKGTYTYHLNFYQVFPGQNYSGLFVVRLQSGNNSVAQKAIKMH